MFDSALLELELKHINLDGFKKLLDIAVSGLLGRKEKGISLGLLAFLLNMLRKKTKSIIQSVEKEEHRVKSVFNVAGQKLEVCVRRIELKRKDNPMKLMLEIDKINLDALLDGLLDEKFSSESKDNQLVYSILKAVNASTKDEKKYELIQLLLNWLNSTTMVNDVLRAWIAQQDGKTKQFLEGLELEVGNITLELKDE